jgi:hypothetical protein
MRLSRSDAVGVAVLLTVLGLLAYTAPRWAVLLRWGVPEATGEGPQAPAPSAGPSAAETRISVKLLFASEMEPALVSEERAVAFSPELARQLRLVLEEIVRGSQAGHLAPLPADTKVLAVFVTAEGVAYVDLSKEAATGHPGGSLDERLSVYAVVDTLASNFPAVRRVQILIDGKPAATLAGHMDLSRPLMPDLTLIAEPSPSPSPAPEGVAPASAPTAVPSSPQPSPSASARR